MHRHVLRCAPRRLLATTAGALVVVVLLAVPADAHASDASGVPSNYRTTITDVSPAVPGLRIRVVERGSRLALRWTGSGELQVLGPEREPYLRLSALGIETNLESPASYRDDDRRGLTPVPSDADKGPPRWKRLSSGPELVWHEHRAHWTELKGPKQVQDSPHEPTRVRDWTVPLIVDGKQVEVRGTLDYLPGPSPIPYVLILLVAGALAVPALRTPGLGAVACVLVVAADVVRVAGVTATAADRPWSAGLQAMGAGGAGWLILLVAAVGLLRSRPGALVLAAVGGVLVALTGAVPAASDLNASLPLTELPLVVHRIAIAVALGVGLGLLVGLIAAFRRLSMGQEAVS